MPLLFVDHNLKGDSAMHLRTWPATALALLATLGAALPALTSNALSAQPDGLGALDGEWIYVEDRTEGRALEQLGPPMSAKFSMRTEEGVVILVSGHGSGNRNVRVALDGSASEVPGAGAGTFARYRGAWKDGAFTYETEFVRAPGQAPEGLIRREFRITTDGLLVRATSGSPATSASVGLYRHPQDIALPTPTTATIGDLAWLAGAWVGTRGAGGATSIEERWSPPLGGAMLAVSRTVARGKMSAFEFLRIVERDGGLVYIAQPGGAAPTEFVLTELGAKRAVFENPRHDYPKRIVCELSAEGGLSASIGFAKGGSPRRFEFKREIKQVWEPKIRVQFLIMTNDAAGAKLARFSLQNIGKEPWVVSLPGFVDLGLRGGGYWGFTNATLQPGASVETSVPAPTDRGRWRAEFLCRPPTELSGSSIYSEYLPPNETH